MFPVYACIWVNVVGFLEVMPMGWTERGHVLATTLTLIQLVECNFPPINKNSGWFCTGNVTTKSSSEPPSKPEWMKVSMGESQPCILHIYIYIYIYVSSAEALLNLCSLVWDTPVFYSRF